jgi:periplasmic protein TonB
MRKLGLFALAATLAAGEAAAWNDSEAVSPARAKANLASLFTDQDYPAEAIAAREEGVVGFTLDVGPEGRVTACAVTRSSGSSALDGTTCRLMTSRARFTPAVDAAGEPVADHLAGRIVWRLPPPAPAVAP